MYVETNIITCVTAYNITIEGRIMIKSVKKRYVVLIEGIKPKFAIAENIGEAIKLEEELNPGKEVYSATFMGFYTEEE